MYTADLKKGEVVTVDYVGHEKVGKSSTSNNDSWEMGARAREKTLQMLHSVLFFDRPSIYCRSLNGRIFHLTPQFAGGKKSSLSCTPPVPILSSSSALALPSGCQKSGLTG